jgi:U3 small nucleolar ribonucleoprotein protein IMP3
MVRKLKHHEQKLLRKVDFTTYKSDQNHRAAEVCRRYVIQKPADYTKYNRLCGQLRQLAHKLAALQPEDPIRRKQEELLLGKLWDMGVLGTGGGGRGKLSDVEHKVTVSAFARRRLPVVMQRMGMADHVSSAVKFVEQGHVRVGTDVVTDPAFLVTRSMEDFVTWVDSSKIKRNILTYRDKLDDFDLI